MKKTIILLLIILLSVSFFIVSFLQELRLPKDVGLIEEKLFSVEKGHGFSEIAENLEKQGLIKQNLYFKVYVLWQGYSRSLQAGEYLLSSSMNIPEIAKKMVSGRTASITITVPEGFTQRQIEERLGFVLPGENLEGFLFPDTYQFSFNVSGEEAVKKMRDNFERKLRQELREEIEKQGKTIFEIITMASLIEKEVRTIEDKKLVSGILWKRLGINMPLQVDATIAYILEGEKWSFDQMRREIGAARNIDSPYNTYIYRGLPLGPICNPGIESIEAAVYPQETQYWYYLSTPQGETIFSRTLEEHNIAIVKYLK